MDSKASTTARLAVAVVGCAMFVAASGRAAEPRPGAPAADAGDALPPAVDSADPAVEAADRAPDAREVSGWVLLGLGGASFIAGTVTGILALEQSAQLDAGCEQRRCPPELHGGVDAFHSLRIASTATLAGAAALAIPGVALLLVAPSDGDRAPPASTHRSRTRSVSYGGLWLDVRPAGLRLRGAL